MLLRLVHTHWPIKNHFDCFSFLEVDLVKKRVYISPNIDKTTMNDEILPYLDVLGTVDHFGHIFFFFAVHILIDGKYSSSN